MVIRVFSFSASLSANSDANLESEILGTEPVVPEGSNYKLIEAGGSLSGAGRIEVYHEQKRMLLFKNDTIPSVNYRVVLNNLVESGESFTVHGVDESGASNDMSLLLIVEETKA